MRNPRYVSIVVAFATVGMMIIFCIAFGQRRASNPGPQIADASGRGYQNTLVVAADFDYEPYSFFDEAGRPAGHDIELIRAIAAEMGMNVEVRLMDWSDACRAVQDGTVDLLLGLGYEPKAFSAFELSAAMHDDPFVAFGTDNFTRIGELYHKKIAAAENSGCYTTFLRPYKLEDEATSYRTCREAIASVAAGVNDYAIVRYSVGQRALARMGCTSVKAVGPILSHNHLCMGAKKGDRRLIAAVDAAILTLTRNGFVDRLSNKWIGGRYVEALSTREFLQANIIEIAGSVIALWALLYAYMNWRRLKAAARQRESLDQMLEYHRLFIEATKGLYENIYELDITHNRLGSESTRRAIESLGAPGDFPYDKVLKYIARKQIKAEYRQGYLDAFLPERVLEAYQNGVDSLQYDFMATKDGQNYYWIRLAGRIFYWRADCSVRMIAYRQNIDAQKRYERRLLEKLQRDQATGLYNKQATEEMIDEALKYSVPETRSHAFLILDIDHFKSINDQLGHAFGDIVIGEFAASLKKLTRHTDIVGRVGGDEFVIFLKNIPEGAWIQGQARLIVDQLRQEITVDGQSRRITVSVGVALCPRAGADFATLYQNADRALYLTKESGRDGFTIYEPEPR